MQEKYFLYHQVPDDMQGTVLYPLYVLQEKYPALYIKKLEKYAGRERVLAEMILPLHCRWNDALHFTAVHPSVTKKALLDAGGTDLVEKSFYQIDPDALDPALTTVYLYAHATKGVAHTENDFTAFHVADLATYAEIPSATKKYFQESFTRGERPIRYFRIPHILYKGSLDVSHAPVITV